MSKTPSRILAVEIRAGRLGYAAFETPNRLLDFGAAWFDSSATARLRIASLLRIFRPSVLLLRKGSSHRSRKNTLRKSVARIVRSEGRKLSISIALMTDRVFDAYFERNSCRNKYNIAALLATWFPEIAWRLPPRRKFYEPEARAMLYFDAAALGAAYLAQQNPEPFRRPLDGVAK
jgi:hypothetical protein